MLRLSLKLQSIMMVDPVSCSVFLFARNFILLYHDLSSALSENSINMSAHCLILISIRSGLSQAIIPEYSWNHCICISSQRATWLAK